MVRSLVPSRSPRTFTNFHSEMESLLDFAFGNDQGAATHFAPRVNISEADTQYEVTADLPGLKPDDVTVELEDGRLLIAGEMKQESQEDGRTFHRVERRFGKFRRIISVPETVDAEKINAEFHSGVLVVTLPKTEKVKPKRIDVKTS